MQKAGVASRLSQPVIGYRLSDAYVRPSRNALSLRDRDGWRSLRSAFASICRILSLIHI